MNKEILEIDIRGQVCPSSLILVLRAVNEQHNALIAGKLNLRVMTDNRDATGTVPEAVENMGLTVDVAKTDGYYSMLIGRADVKT